jgi:putative Holliday junction resolvase
VKKNKILAIDFGESNVGLAITDPGANIVFGKGLIKGGKSLEDLFSKIKKICDDEEVNKIVFGLPYGKDGEDTDQTKRLKKMGLQMQEYLKNIPLEFEDESFSSFEAREIAEGFEEKELKSRYSEHEIAAMVILRKYLKHHPEESGE